MMDVVVQDYVLDVSFAAESFHNFHTVCPSDDDYGRWQQFRELAETGQMTVEQYNAFFEQGLKRGSCYESFTVPVLTPVAHLTQNVITAKSVAGYDMDTQVYLREPDGSATDGSEYDAYAVLTALDASDIRYGQDGLYHQQFHFTLRFNHADQLFYPFATHTRQPYDRFAPMLIENTMSYYQNAFDELNIEYSLELLSE